MMKLISAHTRRILFGCFCTSVLLCSFTKPEHTEIPRIWFTENSSIILDDSSFYVKEGRDALPGKLLTWIANTLEENPATVMNITGYADTDENKPTDLGMQRSLVIKDSL